ncbi:hypothetical protein [uncultured Shewanella sp.]|uniref:hypothetical protein n=1 Tax=uncultured Shewanella sp. TaxID=173975 RepID=UPI00263070B0|nr:hypothetical protein [uncultured Shewanella sp.]
MSNIEKSHQDKVIEDKDNELIETIMQLLIAAETKENAPLIDRIRKSFQVLEMVSAICIAEAAEDTENLAEISTQLHEGVTKLAVMIFEENRKANLNIEKNQKGEEGKDYIRA